MPDPARFDKTYDVIRTDDELGLVYGWGAIFTEDGEEYFDTQGDAIDPSAMEIAALDFAENSSVAGEMHEGECGTVPFILPITPEVRDAFEMKTPYTGLAIAMKPNPEVFAKFKSGEYTGFSMGGTRIEETVVEKFSKRDQHAKGAGKFRQGKKRRMTKFTIEEYSAVDSPAQVGAKALLLKRRGTSNYDPKNRDPSKRGRLEKRALLTTVTQRHSHLLIVDSEFSGDSFGEGSKAHGFTSFEDDHEHPWIMKDDGTIVIGEVNGHKHEPGEMSTSREQAKTLLAKRKGATMPDGDIEKRLARAEALAEMNDVQKAHYTTLEDDGKTAYLAKSSKERQVDADREISKRNAEDPVMHTMADGTEIKKSAGDLVLKLAKDSDTNRREVTKLRAERRNSEFEKRAVSELPHLPGSTAEKAAVLKALDGIDDPKIKKAAIAAVHAGNSAIKAAFGSRGYGGQTDDGLDAGSSIMKANDELEILARKHMTENADVNYEDAYERVSDANPELLKRALGHE